VKELAGLKQLQMLDVCKTKVTFADLAELEKAMPWCEIIYRP